MFADVYKALVFSTKRHKADAKYPNLETDESAALRSLFERFEATTWSTFAAWRALMTEVGRLLHQSSWTFVQIATSIGDRLRQGPAPTATVWNAPPCREDTQKEQGLQRSFICNEERYSEQERKEIVTHYEQQFKASRVRREPTELEWKIMTGMLEGDIIATRLLQFMRQISSSESLWRFQLTIKAQVEGHLTGRLTDNTPVYAHHQTTKRLVEEITLAARQHGEGNERLFAMLKVVKRMEYHAGSHSLKIFFYTRAEAARWAGTVVPFRRQRVVLTDVHAPEQEEGEQSGRPKRTIWERQTGADGGCDVDARFRYKVELMNMSSFMGIAAFLAMLEQRLNTPFLADSIKADRTRYTVSTAKSSSRRPTAPQRWLMYT